MVQLDSITPAPEVLGLIPKATALEMSVLPLSVIDGAVLFAAQDGYSRSLKSDLEFFLGKKVAIETYPADMVTAAIQRCYNISDIEARRSSSSSKQEFLSVKDDDRGSFSVSGITPSSEHLSEHNIVPLVNGIITDAIQMGASDIHVEPYERQLRIRYRLDGVLHEVLKPQPEKAKPLISRLKIMADLDIAEKRRPQDGRIRVKQGDRVIDIRVSSLPTNFGEKIVLRILDQSRLELDLAKLGFEERDLKLFKKTVHLPYGMVLVTGPTGSGKTTTLYAALNYINSPEVNITTIEDPIEYNLPGINQTHVRTEIGLTFAAALRSILRQDPNVIMVGEIRDAETAEIAIRSALTGHLVFSTLHTNDTPSAIVRLIEMGIEPFLVASSVKMILAQRLLRRLCEHCKEQVEPTQEQLEEISSNLRSKTVRYYGPKGCSVCHQTGYSGRSAVYEVLPIQNGISDLISKSTSVLEIGNNARKRGMQTLREAALEKVQRGETSLEEALRETALG